MSVKLNKLSTIFCSLERDGVKPGKSGSEMIETFSATFTILVRACLFLCQHEIISHPWSYLLLKGIPESSSRTFLKIPLGTPLTRLHRF